jgi:hypothetical protein
MLLTCSLWDLFAKKYLRVRCWRLLQLYLVCVELACGDTHIIWNDVVIVFCVCTLFQIVQKIYWNSSKADLAKLCRSWPWKRQVRALKETCYMVRVSVCEQCSMILIYKRREVQQYIDISGMTRGKQCLRGEEWCLFNMKLNTTWWIALLPIILWDQIIRLKIFQSSVDK